jgi:hypothetical protein
MPTNPAESRDPATSSTPAIRISGASGLVTSVPYLLGFEPRDSIVVVFTSRESGRVVLCLRVDSQPPDPGPVAPRAEPELPLEIGAAVRRALAAGARLELAHVVVFDDTARDRPLQQTSVKLRAELGVQGVELGEWLAATGDRWWHYVCPAPDCCPEAGHECDDSAGTRAAFDLVTAGVGFAASREALADRLMPEGATLLPADVMARALAESVLHAVSRSGGVTWRRAREDELVAMASPPGGGALSIDTVAVGLVEDLRAARWAVALQDPRVREPLMHRLLFGGSPARRVARLQSARGVLTELVRRTPAPEVAAVAATLAAVAWQQGDGAFARLAAERALAADTGNVLAGLIRHAAGSGLPPSQWQDVLACYTPAMLRGTRPMPAELDATPLDRAG